MDYVQMTLSDWMSLKKEIAEEFARASASFVRIGYLLRKAEDSEGYKNDGYDSLAEWAKAELGLTATYVSRFKAINAKYSVDGYSDRLRTEFLGFGSAKLGEMLALPDADMEMITPETKRDDIRALKEFNREAPEPEKGEQWITDLIAILKEDVREDIAKAQSLGTMTGRACSQILNPGGNRMMRTKAAMIAMSEDGLTVKTFGADGGRKKISWQEFADQLPVITAKEAEKDDALPEEEKKEIADSVETDGTEKTGEAAGTAEAADGNPEEPAEEKTERTEEPEETVEAETAGEALEAPDTAEADNKEPEGTISAEADEEKLEGPEKSETAEAVMNEPVAPAQKSESNREENEEYYTSNYKRLKEEAGEQMEMIRRDIEHEDWIHLESYLVLFGGTVRALCKLQTAWGNR